MGEPPSNQWVSWLMGCWLEWIAWCHGDGWGAAGERRYWVSPWGLFCPCSLLSPSRRP